MTTALERLSNEDLASTWLDVVMVHYDATIVSSLGPNGQIHATLIVNLTDPDRVLEVTAEGVTATFAVDRLSTALMQHPLFKSRIMDTYRGEK